MVTPITVKPGPLAAIVIALMSLFACNCCGGRERLTMEELETELHVELSDDDDDDDDSDSDVSLTVSRT